MHFTQLPADVLALLRRGTVIPAHLLALDASRRLDRRRQRAGEAPSDVQVQKA